MPIALLAHSRDMLGFPNPVSHIANILFTSIAFSLEETSNAFAFHFWAAGLTKLTGAAAEHPYLFTHAIASALTKTTSPANWLVE